MIDYFNIFPIIVYKLTIIYDYYILYFYKHFSFKITEHTNLCMWVEIKIGKLH